MIIKRRTRFLMILPLARGKVPFLQVTLTGRMNWSKSYKKKTGLSIGCIAVVMLRAIIGLQNRGRLTCAEITWSQRFTCTFLLEKCFGKT